jgi:hypothetical protein
MQHSVPPGCPAAMLKTASFNVAAGLRASVAGRNRALVMLHRFNLNFPLHSGSMARFVVLR